MLAGRPGRLRSLIYSLILSTYHHKSLESGFLPRRQRGTDVPSASARRLLHIWWLVGDKHTDDVRLVAAVVG
jgi:hypothetical protein